MTDDYGEFLELRTQRGADHGFEPIHIPADMFDFQSALVAWALRKGRAAIFADTGLGKTFMQLVWADNVVRFTNRSVLLLTPLAVAYQTVTEAGKFGVAAVRSSRGELPSTAQVVVTNYERLHLFNPADFAAVVCDESSILKSFDGVIKEEVTAFMRKVPYRLLCTATAAPNDYVELGTSSEALGYLGHVDMLGRFFRTDGGTAAEGGGRFFGRTMGIRFKGHAELPFWRWVASWARAVRKPSDLGFSDDRYVLPPLVQNEHVVHTASARDGLLFNLPAVTIQEQREERRRTIDERCNKVAELINGTGQPALAWCHLNPEGDLLKQLIPDAVQVSGADTDEEKEEAFLRFVRGDARVLITKPQIGAWGLNFQHCAHVTMFPSHSFEQTYQSIRRCYRFGQTRPVVVDTVTTEGERGVVENLRQKAEKADKMFSALVAEMNRATHISKRSPSNLSLQVPSWLTNS